MLYKNLSKHFIDLSNGRAELNLSIDIAGFTLSKFYRPHDDKTFLLKVNVQNKNKLNFFFNLSYHFNTV